MSARDNACPVPRTVTEVLQDSDRQGARSSLPLSEFRPEPAYVLLGDPGTGKTTALDIEEHELGPAAQGITARDFLAFEVASHPEWRGKTLFIDGLDEVRAGSRDGRMPIDRLRGKLDALGQPNFRVSCREADWLGRDDRDSLVGVAPGGKVTVLRLDPLSTAQAESIVRASDYPGDSEAFIAIARKRGVDALLRCPQSLQMLLEAVADGGGWPEGRLQTFERACSSIVREHNQQHRVARVEPGVDELLDAAGRLCAVLLISGAAGYRLTPSNTDKEYLDHLSVGGHTNELLRDALSTKLFRACGENRLAPVHRHVAEFLGARHLAGVIKSGVPALRVVSLITGDDGIVVTPLRGLSAWLAAHSNEARGSLIERDPIGVGLYGDISGFSSDERRQLLISLSLVITRLNLGPTAAAAFAPLATAELEPEFRDVLTGRRRSKEHQLLAEFVLRILRSSTPLPKLSGVALDLIRDDTWWPRVRVAALDAFIQCCDDSAYLASSLRTLVAAIQEGQLHDPGNELLGTLLTHLYPEHLAPSEVWNYLSATEDPDLIGRYLRFWDVTLLEESTDEHVPALLDHLSAADSRLRSVIERRLLEHLPMRLLARGLQVHGDQADPVRLGNWLRNSPASKYDRDPRETEAVLQVGKWLQNRPTLHMKLFEEQLEHCQRSDFGTRSSEWYFSLLDSARPSDFGLRCLERGVALVKRRPRIAEWLLERAVQAYQQQAAAEGLSIALLRRRAQGIPTLQRKLTEQLDRSTQSVRPSPTIREPNHREERRQRYSAWVEDVRRHFDALRCNRAPPRLLHDLGRAYFGYHPGDRSLAPPPERIRYLFHADDGMARTALSALREAVRREDVPSAEEVIRLREESRMHLLSFAILASVAKLKQDDPVEFDNLDERQHRTAIALYFCVPAGYTESPDWYRRLLATRPELITDVFAQYVASAIRTREVHVSGLYELAYHKDHGEVARRACLPLLRAFPLRHPAGQLIALDYLLWAALQHADRAELRSLIELRLARTSMTLAQRVHWLAAGLVTSADYREPIQRLVDRSPSALGHLQEFFAPDERLPFLIADLDVPAADLLVRLFGSSTGPWTDHDDFPSLSERVAMCVWELVRRLSSLSHEEACRELETLHGDVALAGWHSVLADARERQGVLRRDSLFEHPSSACVVHTLQNGPPANAADLAALVTDHLGQIGDRMLTSDLNYWRHFWNEDPYGRPTDPKSENSCRDALVAALRSALPDDVHTQPEVRHALNSRADISVTCDDFHIPIEVKLRSSPDLWSALHSQLIAKYTGDPATTGCGIYVVLWLGEPCKLPNDGRRPRNATELQTRLDETLDPHERRKVSVVVVDISTERIASKRKQVTARSAPPQADRPNPA